MKFQYSLRTLIIACLVAGFVLYFVVGWYTTNLVQGEMRTRYSILRELVLSVAFEIEHKKWPGNHVPDDIGPEVKRRTDGSWELKSTMQLRADSGKGLEIIRQLTGIRITCMRSGPTNCSLVLEYDDSSENKILVDILKQEFVEQKWQYTLKHVEKIERDKR